MQATEHELWAQRIAAALAAAEPLPALPDDLSLADGYAIQSALIPRIDPQGPAGLKAGVTQARAQRGLGIDHALLGRLYRRGELANGARIRAATGLAIECELGIRIDSGGGPSAFGPALEIVRPAFASSVSITAPGLLASNLAAEAFMSGPE